jgi:hypothetical protein
MATSLEAMSKTTTNEENHSMELSSQLSVIEEALLEKGRVVSGAWYKRMNLTL